MLVPDQAGKATQDCIEKETTEQVLQVPVEEDCNSEQIP